ncbi:uncharacterized protein Smp_202600 [Schistosoma mansoni]|uniref:uncharacterized protein n=1 Tax=Schistosoma mansoni TaxID=6183 RepID=UPI00022DBFAC|nr:uncharacterized protein Smp_202600 [Schistosoma mansoni]|eukprot:XP_018652348.1 uncharacterized protein Smp_202600 [Schistosoma mansoni]
MTSSGTTTSTSGISLRSLSRNNRPTLAYNNSLKYAFPPHRRLIHFPASDLWLSIRSVLSNTYLSSVPTRILENTPGNKNFIRFN